MRAELPAWCVLMLALLFGGAGAGGCVRGRSWWDRALSACVPCTQCDAALRQVVKQPCDIHRDTICHSLYQIQIFPNDSAQELSDIYYDYNDSDVGRSETSWDIQTSTLTLAACGCVVFFIVVLILSIYHAKQWKILKEALQSDVKDLSAKLKLMESGIEPPAEHEVPTNHHIYCNIHVGKDTLTRPMNGKKGLEGNVYTQQEKHAS